MDRRLDSARDRGANLYQAIRFEKEAGELHIDLDFREDALFMCSVCGAESQPVYGGDVVMPFARGGLINPNLRYTAHVLSRICAHDMVPDDPPQKRIVFSRQIGDFAHRHALSQSRINSEEPISSRVFPSACNRSALSRFSTFLFFSAFDALPVLLPALLEF